MTRRIALLLIIATGVFGIAGNGAAQCPNTAQPAVQQSPVNQDLAGPTVTFTWTPSNASGITGYDVVIGNTPGSTTSACSAAANATTCSANIPPGSYFWIVRAKIANCTPGFDSASAKQFTVGCPTSPPTTQFPADNAQNVSTSPTLTWSPVANADSYDVYLGASGAGCIGQPVSTITSGTQFTPQKLQDGTNYEWRVIAKRSGSSCTPVTSFCTKFQTAVSCTPAGSFNLTAPTDKSSVTTQTPTFTWTASSGAAQYVLRVGTVNPPSATNSADVIVQAPATTYTIGTPLSPGTYYWQVTAVPACGTAGARSGSVFSFVVPPCPSGPTITAPTADARLDGNQQITVSWTPVTGATGYDIFVSSDNGATYAITKVSGGTSFTYAAGLFNAGTYLLYLRATVSTNCQPVSNKQTLTIFKSLCPANPGSPSIISPADGAKDLSSPVTFTWTAVPQATSYRVYGTVGTAARSLLGTTTATSLTATVPAGAITWFVEARFATANATDDCPSTYSKTATITVVAAGACGTAAATLTSPSNGATGVKSPVEFKWNAVPGAAGYKLYVATASAASGDLVGATTSDTSITRIVPDGAITWWVDTVYAGCNDVRSAKFTFTAGTPVVCGGSITLTAPANNATVNSPVNFSWTSVSGASSYRLWVSFEGGSPAAITRTTATSVTGISIPSGTIEWYVEVFFDNTCPSITSGHNKFTVAKAATCDAHKAATPISPVGGAGTTSPVEFNWTAVDTAAKLFRVWVSVNGDAFGDIGLTTDTKLKHDVGAGTVLWFVESIFEGCPSLKSATATFTIPRAGCATDAPLLIAPPAGSQNVVSPVTLVWTAVAGAQQYRVFAATSATSEVTLVATTDATTITRVLPPGSYAWLVEAVFDKCASTRSARASFTVPKAQTCATDKAQPVSPQNKATNVTAPVRLAWNPVSGALLYVLTLRRNDGSPTRVAETTGTDFTADLRDGDYEWFVESFFSACPSTESDHFTFTVPPSACDNRAPSLHTPADHASGLVSPVQLGWSHVPKAKSYKVWGAAGDQGPSILGTTTDNKLTAPFPPGKIRWYVEAFFDNCPSKSSAVSAFSVREAPPACTTPERPEQSAPGEVLSGTPYTVRWSAVPNASHFDLQESTNRDFDAPSTQVLTDLQASFIHTAAGAPVRYFYRVRAISDCSEDKGRYSAVDVVAVMPATTANKHASVEVGVQGGVSQNVFIPGTTPPVSFTARPDKPWATVTPTSGILGPDGVTLVLTTDPAALALGTNTATILLTYSANGKTFTPLGSTPAVVPVSVSMVTPVSSTGKSSPPPDSLIIPAVGHAQGANDSFFESDVRLTNTAAQTQKYQLNFTITGADGTQSGQSTTVDVGPGATMALDDILTSFFGVGSDGSGATGVLEIRPLNPPTGSFGAQPSVSLSTVASSRTYNQTPTGTFGQFIPAIPFSQFIGKPADGAPKSLISLQQIAQSTAYRTNFGLVEASGQAAEVMIHVFDKLGAHLAQIPQSIPAGGHVQLNNFLAANNLSLDDGRLEVEVISNTGKVSAYASVVDNVTNDPLLVFPVIKNVTQSTRYALPGVGDFDIGIAHWKSDLRLFNPSTSDLPITLSYYAKGDPAHPQVYTTKLLAGEERAIDNAIETLFNLHSTAGSAIISTSAPSALVATARTYTQLASGTYGQFIPGITPEQSIGTGSRLLQLLQLEQSSRFRTNIGLSETSGNPATVEVQLILPDSKSAPKVTIPLAANEYTQFSLLSFGLSGDLYNVRATVKVISGTGKVTAYGSVIDQVTQDPTYVPAQ